MKLTEDELRKITLSAINELGENATPELVKKVVSEAVLKVSGSPEINTSKEKTTGRVILTSFGINTPGIVSAITSAVSKAECDIEDISQKIMGDFFTMIMIIDITNSPKDLREVQEDMNQIAEKLRIKIYLQHEDVFRYMHRI